MKLRVAGMVAGAAFVSIVVACSSSSSDTGSSSGGDSGTASSSSSGGSSTSSSSSSSSGGSSSGDSGPTDSGNDANNDGGDSGASLACQAYCTCMTNNCAGTAPQGAGCLAACAAQTTWDLTCRTTHCGFASADPGTHCPHAGGVSTCQ